MAQTQATRTESRTNALARLTADNKVANTADWTHPKFGWNAQQPSGLAKSYIRPDKQVFTSGQLPDPSVIAAAGMPPFQIPSNQLA